jgi:hypothetical protein
MLMVKVSAPCICTTEIVIHITLKLIFECFGTPLATSAPNISIKAVIASFERPGSAKVMFPQHQSCLDDYLL